MVECGSMRFRNENDNTKDRLIDKQKKEEVRTCHQHFSD